MSILLGLLTFALFFLSVIIVLLVLMQRSSAGMGSAMGGGAADQALGAESSTILSKWTQFGVIGFFVFGFALYLGHQYIYTQATERAEAGSLRNLTFEDEASDDLDAPAAGTGEVTLPIDEALVPETIPSEDTVPATNQGEQTGTNPGQ